MHNNYKESEKVDYYTDYKKKRLKTGFRFLALIIPPSVLRIEEKMGKINFLSYIYKQKNIDHG